MKRMFLLFSHNLTSEQESDARDNLKVEEFVKLPEELQQLWSNIPPEIEDLNPYLEPIKEYLQKSLQKGDVALVQGDFGATCKIAKYVKELGGIAVYATTKREVSEEKVGDVIKKISHFKHIRFRKYE